MTQHKNGYEKNSPGNLKAVGAILASSPIKCQLVCITMSAGNIRQCGDMIIINYVIRLNVQKKIILLYLRMRKISIKK